MVRTNASPLWRPSNGSNEARPFGEAPRAVSSVRSFSVLGWTRSKPPGPLSRGVRMVLSTGSRERVLEGKEFVHREALRRSFVLRRDHGETIEVDASGARVVPNREANTRGPGSKVQQTPLGEAPEKRRVESRQVTAERFTASMPPLELAARWVAQRLRTRTRSSARSQTFPSASTSTSLSSVEGRPSSAPRMDQPAPSRCRRPLGDAAQR